MLFGCNEKMNVIISHFTPIKKVSRSLTNHKTKPRITKINLKSTKVKDKKYKKMRRTKNVSKKQELNLTSKVIETT